MATTSTPAERLWGLDTIECHDRYWYAHGVEVVRRGRPRRGRRAARLFMLLGPQDLVLGEMPAAARHRRTGGLLLGLRAEATPTVERVQADALGRLVRIERRYRDDGSRPHHRLVLTRDARVADAWSSSEIAPRWPRLRVLVRTGRWQRGCMCGEHFDARDIEACRRFTRALMRCWDDPMWAVPGVRPVRPGAWAHETARIRPGARLVGPVWLGAGAVVPADAVIIGPAALPDVIPAAAPTDWDHPPPLRPARHHRAPGGAGRVRAALRRGFDMAFASCALLAMAPLCPVIAWLIWREDGRPILFAHTRQARDGRDFTCYKFRTMCRDAEQRRGELVARNLADGPQFHIPDDPRLLRIGRWLRRFHLDELPQFWNVLRGQMSVVGPRPSPDDENQCCPAWREVRLSVRPGMTGLWQVCRTRRRHADFQEWIRYDLEYVRRRSWRMDLWILLQTVGKVLVRSGDENGARSAGRAERQ